MNVINLLKKQHRDIEKLFAKIGEEDRTLEEDLIDALEHHAFIEEMFFYPALITKKETQSFVEPALKDYNELKTLIHSWEQSRDQKWKDTANKIKVKTEQHIEKEEKELFPKVEKAFTLEELEKLGVQMMY
jgi:hemerythrin-like domain-containing protein